MKRLSNNPFLLFLPFLVLSIIVVILYPTHGTNGDESRYLIYARYMIDGYLPPGNLDFDHLGNGPGYSIIIIPFISFGIPIIWITITNAIFLYFSNIFLFKSLSKFSSHKVTVIVSLFWAFYFNAYEFLLLILPEVFSIFLMSLLFFCVINVFHSPHTKKYIILSGLVLGYAALTKPIFGYIIIFALIGAIIIWLFNKRIKSYKSIVVVLLIAFAVTIPYLAYTYKVTNKMLYWSTLGGNNFYWMTSTEEAEYGDWLQDPGKPIDANSKSSHTSDFEEQVKQKHGGDYVIIDKFKGVQLDSVYKALAIKNIKNHPVKFLQNCFSNVGRILFNYPFSYKLQNPRTLLRLPFNGLMVVLVIFGFIPILKNWKKIYFPIRFMIIFVLIYLGGSILGSAETRMFSVVAPIILPCLAHIYERSFKIKLKFD